MKKISLGRNGKKVPFFLMLLFLGLFAINPLKAQTGSSCSTVIAMPAHGGYDLSETTTYTDTWYSLVTDSANIQIDVFNSDLSPTGISSISLYSGICSGLSLVTPTGTPILGENLSYTYTGLTLNATYYVKFSKGNTTSTTYGYSLMNLKTNAATCSAGCPANPNNNAYNTCQAVCNGGFEYILDSIYGISQIYKACPWDATGQNDGQGGTPDAFNTVVSLSATTTGYRCKVPNNFAGYQNPLHGNGYAGFITYASPYTNLREYVVEPLNTPLLAGKKYTVSFWVNLGGRAGYATSGIGAWLSNTNPNALGEAGILAQNPQIKGSLYNSVITDTTSWVYITDTFTVPTGNTYYYIAIGCFKNDASNGHTAVPHTSSSGWGPGSIGSLGYYYVDEVSILPFGSISVTVSPSPVCNGDPVKLVATSNIGSGYYLWSTNPATSIIYDHAPYYDTVYSVPASVTSTMYIATTNVPSYGNCTISDSIKPIWLAGPVNVNAGNDTSLCVADTLFLHGQTDNYADSTYWTDATGSLLCTMCLNDTVIATPPTYYVFHAENTVTHCSRTDTLYVLIPPPPSAAISGVIFGCDSSATYCPAVLDTSVTYTWVAWDDTYTSQVTFSQQSQTCILIDWFHDNGAGGGHVILTATSEGGCSSTDTLDIVPCCRNPVTGAYLYNNSISALFGAGPHVFSSVKPYINGTLTVDENTHFVDSKLNMGPYAKIVVSGGHTLRLEQDSVKGGCCSMWDDMEGTSVADSIIVYRKSYVGDGIRGIVSNNGSVYRIYGNVIFNRNYVSVTVNPYAGIHGGTVREATFTSISSNYCPSEEGTLLPPYTGQWPLYAIGVADVDSITFGDASQAGFVNTFSYLRNGIWVNHSNATIVNNTFVECDKEGLTSKGICAYSKYPPLLGPHKKVVIGGNTAGLYEKNTFYDCPYGVYIDTAMSALVQNNEFQQTALNFSLLRGTGIYVARSIGFFDMNIEIRDNTIIDHEYSISCYDNQLANIEIRENTIYRTLSGAMNGRGVYMYNPSSSNGASVYSVHHNTITGLRWGVYVNSVPKVSVDNNNIYVRPTVSSLYPALGVAVLNSPGAKITSNKVYQEDPYGSPITQNWIGGIYAGNSPNVIFNCNTVDGLAFGERYAGPSSTNSTIYNNASVDVDRGIWLNNGALPGQQGNLSQPSDNSWSGTATWDFYTSGPIPTQGQFSAFYYRNSGAYIPSSSGDAGGSNQPVPYYISTSSPDPLFCAYLQPAIGLDEDGNSLNRAVAFGQVDFGDYTAEGTWLAREGLYRAMLLDTTIEQSDTVMTLFKDSVETSNLGLIVSAMDALSDTLPDMVNKAVNDLAVMSPVNTIESNYKVVLGILLLHKVDGMPISATELSTLQAIAELCPFTDGNAVYMARGAILPYDTTDYTEFCEFDEKLNNRQARPGEADQGTIRLYPNPSSGVVNVSYQLQQGESGSVEIYSTTGELVASHPLKNEGQVQSFELPSLAAGVYLCKVVINGELRFAERLVIIQ